MSKHVLDDLHGRLIDSSNNASKRSRQNYFILSLTSCFIILGVFNMEYSWGRHMNFIERPLLAADRGLFPENEELRLILLGRMPLAEACHDETRVLYNAYVDNMSETYASEFFKRFELHIPVLGIRMFSSDLSVLAALALTVLCTWLFYSIRREVHIVRRIHKEFAVADSTADDDTKARLYYGTVFENVFTTATHDDTLFPFLRRIPILGRILNPGTVLWVLRCVPTIALALAIHSDFAHPGPRQLADSASEIENRKILSIICLCYVSLISARSWWLDSQLQQVLAEMQRATEPPREPPQKWTWASFKQDLHHAWRDFLAWLGFKSVAKAEE